MEVRGQLRKSAATSSGEKDHVKYSTEGWVNPRSKLDALKKRQYVAHVTYLLHGAESFLRS
jgi:hypothetical protein